MCFEEVVIREAGRKGFHINCIAEPDEVEMGIFADDDGATEDGLFVQGAEISWCSGEPEMFVDCVRFSLI
jgi:hypothetical protein